MQLYSAFPLSKTTTAVGLAAGAFSLSQCTLPMESEIRSPGSRSMPTWSIQYQGAVVPLGKDFHIVDLFECTDADLAKLKAGGTLPIAYFSSQYEDWRPDAKQFPKEALGNPLDTWEGERWVNPTNQKVRQIMLSRLDMAKQRGFHGVDLDNVDFYDHPNGVGAGKGDAADYVRFLAEAAHARGLKFGLKNATALIGPTRDVVDFYVNEQAHEYGDLDEYRGVTKPIFCIEYRPLRAAMRGFYTIYKPDMNAMDAREKVVPNLP